MWILAVPAGAIIDRYRNRQVLGVSTTLALSAMVWASYASFSGDMNSFFAARILGGVAIVTTLLAGVKEAGARRGDWGRGVFLSAVPAGWGAAHVGAPLLSNLIAWELIFAVFGVFSAGTFVLYWVRTNPTAESPLSPTLADYKIVLTDWELWTLGVSAFAASGIMIFLNIWMPTYVSETIPNISLEGGSFVTAVFPLVGIAGRQSSHYLSEELFYGRRKPVVRYSFLCLFTMITLLMTLAIAYPDSLNTVTLLILVFIVLNLILTGYVSQVVLALLYTYVSELLSDASSEGTGQGILTMLGLFGAFVAPGVGGFFKQWAGYLGLFAFGTILAALGVVAIGVVRESNP